VWPSSYIATHPRLAQDYCGTSDPYVEIYVNDVKKAVFFGIIGR
jgi:hypothetical protein